MNSLVKSIVQPILEQEGKNIALVPGGFKPPTVGHFALVDEVAKNSNIDKVIVLIGHKDRDGVTKEESKAIWDIYQKYLPPNVEIKIADNPSPIADITSYIKNNPETMYYPVVGIRGEMDLGDLKRFDSLEGKYPNFKTIVIKSEGENRISGTNTRAALIGGEKERFQSYIPTELTDEEKDKVWSILTKTPLNEIMYAEPSKFSYPTVLSSLIQYMLSKGMNIQPLPKVKFIDDDDENAQDFFGKTAYYQPDNNLVVLYTYGRHPKDIMRSFAHEMIHHEQKCDGRIGGKRIKTNNVNEDEYLKKIEKEAYLKGNIIFREWTDSISPRKNKLNESLQKIVLEEGRYDKITNQISSAIFNEWKKDFENGKDSSRVNKIFPFEEEEIDIDANISFIPNIGELRVDGGADDETDFIEVRFEIDPEKLPEFWEEISFNLKDVIRHEIEHLTHGEGFIANPGKSIEDDTYIRRLIDAELLPKAQYFKLEKEVDANLQGMYLRAKKEKRPFKDVIDTYLDAQDITPEQKEEILNLWRSRLSALNLPKF
jgi:hypothetical protein